MNILKNKSVLNKKSQSSFFGSANEFYNYVYL